MSRARRQLLPFAAAATGSSSRSSSSCERQQRAAAAVPFARQHQRRGSWGNAPAAGAAELQTSPRVSRQRGRGGECSMHFSRAEAFWQPVLHADSFPFRCIRQENPAFLFDVVSFHTCRLLHRPQVPLHRQCVHPWPHPVGCAAHCTSLDLSGWPPYQACHCRGMWRRLLSTCTACSQSIPPGHDRHSEVDEDEPDAHRAAKLPPLHQEVPAVRVSAHPYTT